MQEKIFMILSFRIFFNFFWGQWRWCRWERRGTRERSVLRFILLCYQVDGCFYEVCCSKYIFFIVITPFPLSTCKPWRNEVFWERERERRRDFVCAPCTILFFKKDALTRVAHIFARRRERAQAALAWQLPHCLILSTRFQTNRVPWSWERDSLWEGACGTSCKLSECRTLENIETERVGERENEPHFLNVCFSGLCTPGGGQSVGWYSVTAEDGF